MPINFSNKAIALTFDSNSISMSPYLQDELLLFMFYIKL
nr:hypothetical protein bcere0006_24260 [Bacillus wiedmannii]